MSDHQNYLQRQPDAAKLKLLKRTSWILTTVVLTLVVLMGRYKVDIGVDLSFLPPVHAVLNSLVTVFLILAVLAIKNKNVARHKHCLLYTSPSPRDQRGSRMPSSA